MRFSCCSAVTFALLLLAPFSAVAFNPPEDASGTVKLRIEAPSVVESATVPFAAAVVIENTGTGPVSGQVRLYGTDGWTAAPAEAQSFKAEPGTPLRLECMVTPSAGAYNARYPLHAEAKLDAPVAGRDSLHAILIAEMRRPDPPRPGTALAWKPWPIDGTSAKALLRFPARRAVWQVFGGVVHTTDPGWQGADPVTGTAVDFTTQRAHPDGRDTLMMHPCWRGGAGTVMAEFALQLPEVSCRLTFANAIRETQPGEPASDGVTFRVRVLPFDAPDSTFGEVAFERHTDTKTWLDGEADLSKWAGKAVRLQLESHPGPKNDTTCDESHWSNPMIVPANAPTASAAAPGEAVAPWKAVCNGREVTVIPGSRGLLDAEIRIGSGDKRIVYKGLHVRVLGDDLCDAAGPTVLLQTVAQSNENGLYCRHKLRHGDITYDLVIDWGTLSENAVAQAAEVELWLENTPAPQPWFDVHIEDVALGPGESLPRDVYAGIGNIVREPQDFSLPFDSHQLATSFVGFDFGDSMALVQRVDVPPTRLEFTRSTRTCTLHAAGKQTMALTPCANVWDGIGLWVEKIDTGATATGVQMLRGKMVIDLWGSRYAETAEALKKTFEEVGDYKCVVVWHNWQRWGYDYRLPDIFPPAPECGTPEDFQKLADTCKDYGVIFAPHDNYIDLYPDANGFTYKNVLFSQSGEPVRAWLNEGRGAQAYRWSTDAFWPYMEKNLGLLKNFCAPTGYFVDVWSSIGPYDAWTWDGKYQSNAYTRDAWGKAFTTIRKTLDGAPTISEGGHDQLIGFLDGSQCNHLRVDPNPPPGGDSGFVWRIKCADSERVPWFDAAYHNRFSAHGAGYDPRYRAGLDPRLHGIYSDDYICTEVMDGHPPMVSGPEGWDVLRKAYLFESMNQMDSGRGRVKHVDFENGDLHRQHVIWTDDRGYETWINRGEQDWNVKVGDKSWVLPQYGFLVVKEKNVPLAGITRNDGVIVEWNSKSTPGAEFQGYYNARPPMGDTAAMRVGVDSMNIGVGRAIEAALKWESIFPATTNWHPFVHFLDETGKIVFQADHAFALPATQWTGPATTQFAAKIPENAASGTRYELRVGLWDSGTGRCVMDGTTDGERRVRLGTITITESGFDWTPIEQKPDSYLARINPERRIVDFGEVRTNGAVTMASKCITPLPGCGPFTLMFKAHFGNDQLPATVAAEDSDGNALRIIPLRSDGAWWVLDCTPDVHHYSFSIRGTGEKNVTTVAAIDPGIRLEDYPVVAEQRNLRPYHLYAREHSPEGLSVEDVHIQRVLEIRKGKAPNDTLVYLQAIEWASFLERFLQDLDLNGDGIPNVVIATFSGGAHCCLEYILLELGDPVVEVARVYLGDYDIPPNFRKRGEDLLVDVPESFQSWYSDFGSSKPYVATLIIRADGYRLETSNLQQHHVDVDSLADSIRQAWEDNAAARDVCHPIPPTELFETLREMCYTGAGQDIPKLLDQVWPKDFPGKDAYWERFLESFKNRSYWEDIRKLNGWK